MVRPSHPLPSLMFDSWLYNQRRSEALLRENGSLPRRVEDAARVPKLGQTYTRSRMNTVRTKRVMVSPSEGKKDQNKQAGLSLIWLLKANDNSVKEALQHTERVSTLDSLIEPEKRASNRDFTTHL